MYNNNFLTLEFRNWMMPLLDYPEDKILLEHTRMTGYGFGLRDIELAMKRYKISRYELREIRRKLEGLAVMFEMEVSAGLMD